MISNKGKRKQSKEAKELKQNMPYLPKTIDLGINGASDLKIFLAAKGLKIDKIALINSSKNEQSFDTYSRKYYRWLANIGNLVVRTESFMEFIDACGLTSVFDYPHLPLYLKNYASRYKKNQTVFTSPWYLWCRDESKKYGLPKAIALIFKTAMTQEFSASLQSLDYLYLGSVRNLVIEDNKFVRFIFTVSVEQNVYNGMFAGYIIAEQKLIYGNFTGAINDKLVSECWLMTQDLITQVEWYYVHKKVIDQYVRFNKEYGLYDILSPGLNNF